MSRQSAVPPTMSPERAFRWACCLDLRALKPGNVGSARPGHGMRTQDFIRSARHAAPVLAARETGLGQRIYQAVAATRETVGCNTNLGILLLCAPLLKAAYRPCGMSLATAVASQIAHADRTDTEWVFRAIRLAEPGGLGAAPRHDVHDAASAPLLEVMAAAAHRDRVARAYAKGFSEILGSGRDYLADRYMQWQSASWAMTAVYLHYLAEEADSHVLRRHGSDVAQAVSRKAQPLAQRIATATDPRVLRPALLHLDRELHDKGINPGTCADLAVATACAALLSAVNQERLSLPVGKN